jgi:hypothetical protein
MFIETFNFISTLMFEYFKKNVTNDDILSLLGFVKLTPDYYYYYEK